MLDRRRYKRFSVDGLKIKSKMILANEVNILDISYSGISLKVDKRLNIGAEYSLKISNRGGLINLKGRVVWSRLSETRGNARGDVIPFYTAGMQFSSLSDEALKELSDFIEKHTKEDFDVAEADRRKGQRFHIRFYIGGNEKAILNYPENCSVRKISLGGMLLESTLPLERNSRFPMEIFFHNEGVVRVSGRVASCGRNSDLYDIGIEFIDMPDRGREVITEFIATLSAADPAP